MGSFSHLDFPFAIAEDRWYIPLQAAINEKDYFIKEYPANTFMTFNQNGRPDELYFGFEDVLKHDSIWNDNLLRDMKWKRLYNVNKMSDYKKNLTNLVEMLIDKIIWEHISPILSVEGEIYSDNIMEEILTPPTIFCESVNIILTITPFFSPDNFEEVKKWIDSLCIPFTLKQDMTKRLIKRRALDLFIILKNEMNKFDLIAKMPSADHENIVINQIMKAIAMNTSTCCLKCYPPKPYIISLNITKDNGLGIEEVGDYFYHFSEIDMDNQPITCHHEVAIDIDII